MMTDDIHVLKDNNSNEIKVAYSKVTARVPSDVGINGNPMRSESFRQDPVGFVRSDSFLNRKIWPGRTHEYLSISLSEWKWTKNLENNRAVPEQWVHNFFLFLYLTSIYRYRVMTPAKHTMIGLKITQHIFTWKYNIEHFFPKIKKCWNNCLRWSA